MLMNPVEHLSVFPEGFLIDLLRDERLIVRGVVLTVSRQGQVTHDRVWNLLREKGLLDVASLRHIISLLQKIVEIEALSRW